MKIIIRFTVIQNFPIYFYSSSWQLLILYPYWKQSNCISYNMLRIQFSVLYMSLHQVFNYTNANRLERKVLTMNSFWTFKTSTTRFEFCILISADEFYFFCLYSPCPITRSTTYNKNIGWTFIAWTKCKRRDPFPCFCLPTHDYSFQLKWTLFIAHCLRFRAGQKMDQKYGNPFETQILLFLLPLHNIVDILCTLFQMLESNICFEVWDDFYPKLAAVAWSANL